MRHLPPKIKVNSPCVMGLTGLFEAVMVMIAFFVPIYAPFAMFYGQALDPPPDG